MSAEIEKAQIKEIEARIKKLEAETRLLNAEAQFKENISAQRA
jgi:hypothetical protein